jgi:hypoxanthine phosphoribosyltransferase
MPDYLFIDYTMMGQILEGLVAQLKRLKRMSGVYDFTHVYAPPRGGFPIAVHLSHHLNLQMIEVIDLNYPPDYFEVNDNLLVVDDVIDTGKTFNDLKEMLDNITEEMPTFQYKLAAIHYKPHTIIKPDIYMQEVTNDTWIVYPWESCEDCEKEREDFRERRQITATQRMQKQDQIIWRSFLGDHK